MKRVLAAVALLVLPITAHALSSFMTFFDWNSTALSSQALTTIGQVAAANRAIWANDGRKPQLIATGHTDSSEPDAEELSLRRARTVKDALVREGVPADVISVIGRGAMGQLVLTGAGVKEPQNRRVEIIFEQDYEASFDKGSSNLSAQELQTVVNVAAIYKARTNARLVVEGYTETSEQHALELSQNRADAIKEALMRQGVPGDAITAEGKGASGPRYSLYGGKKTSRYVKIEFH
jgi:outer membrane protein OmpA-like peptidoglycan-associated protein